MTKRPTKNERYITMFNTIARKSQKIVQSTKSRLAPVAAELRLRRQVAFSVLHPQVEIVKRSPTSQIAVGAAITCLALTGNLASAASLAGAWFFSKPLTRAVASGVGAIGLVDAKVLAALERIQAMQVEPATAP